MTKKMTQKVTLQNDSSKRSPLIHAHKAQDWAEIKIIRYMDVQQGHLWREPSMSQCDCLTTWLWWCLCQGQHLLPKMGWKTFV